jgi:hypothetical protein
MFNGKFYDFAMYAYPPRLERILGIIHPIGMRPIHRS